MSKSMFTQGWTLVAAIILLAVAVFEPVGSQPVSAQTRQEAIAYIRSNNVTGDEIRLVNPDGTDGHMIRSTGQEARPFAADRQPAPRNPAAPQAAEVTYLVEWNITASGYSKDEGSGYSKFTTRRITITGDAVYHDPAQGKNSTIPMNLIITDDMYQNIKREYESYHEWRSITDPGRYTGGPDPIWTGYAVFSPYQAPDGTWSMANPFVDWTFVVSGQVYRWFSYRTDQKWYDDSGSSSDSYTLESTYYSDILRALKDMPLTGDPTGTHFRLHTEYTVQTSDIPLTVNFDATVWVAGCQGLAAPIDIANPNLKFVELNLQAEDTTPDGEATLQARVTCQGVPVINAPVVVRLKAVERSGGHNHSDGKRPRGYIDGVEQTANTKFIGITDSDGAVTFAINPGRDLTDKSRGIAGWYIVEAKLEWQGLNSPTERAYINAHLDLVPVPKNDDLYWLYSALDIQVHPKQQYGMPVTVERIQQWARDWWNKQAFHNLELITMGKDPWRIRRLEIASVSLPQGGLFDKRGALPDRMWRPPFRQHRFGEDVNVDLSVVGVVPIDEGLWYKREFFHLGDEYGTWYYDPWMSFGEPYNLRITKAPANPLESSMLALIKSASTDPDVAASAALVNPQGRYVAGAGQTVTYAVGVENVVSDTVASQVELKAALPAGLNFVSANPPQSRMEDSRTPVWDIGSLPYEGAPRPFEVVAQVDPSTAVGTLLTITATATTSSQDTDPVNNQFSDWGLMVQQPGPDLVIGSDLSAVALTAGEPVTFTIQLSNEGNTPASNSRLDLTVPTGITITETSATANVIPNGVRWGAGQLAPGGWQTFTVGLYVDPGLLDLAAQSPDVEPEYPLPFLMTADSDSSDIDPASNQIQVDKRVELPGPDLLVALQAEGTPGPGAFEVGQEITYTLRYANFGNREAGEVSAALLLWPGLTLTESQPAPTTNQLDTTSGVRTLTWNLGELSIGEEGTIELRLRVDDVPEVGSIVQANISSNNIDLNPADNVMMETRYEAYASNEGRYKIYLPVVKRQ